MKVWIVETHWGYMDDATDILIGIWDTEEGAIKGSEEYMNKLLEYQNRYSEEQIEENEGELDKFLESTDDPEKPYPDDLKEYMKWRGGYDPQHYSKHILIREKELNKILYTFE
jgi:hypothetical protein